jgi:hypothetical protein
VTPGDPPALAPPNVLVVFVEPNAPPVLPVPNPVVPLPKVPVGGCPKVLVGVWFWVPNPPVGLLPKAFVVFVLLVPPKENEGVVVVAAP